MKRINEIIKGATVLGIGTFIGKLLGALYRIPLTRFLGGEGLGLYQMVFPVYAVLLDFSGAGVPTALSKIISSYRGEDKTEYAEKTLKTSLKFFLIIGAVFTLLMSVFSGKISAVQGNGKARLAYITLSPAVVIVCVISSFRGYFQGLMNMTPTAVSQIVEQAVKLVFGLIFAYIFLPNIEMAVAGATFAITLSEIFALCYLIILYRKKGGRISVWQFKKTDRNLLKEIITYSLPITVISVMLPLSQVADSFLAVNIIGKYSENATAEYGLLSGVVMTVINLPVALCYGLGVSSLPVVSASKTETEKQKNSIRALFFTLILSLVCSLICYIFAPLAIKILFRSLTETERQTSINLLRLTSPCVIFLSMLQTVDFLLVAYDKHFLPIIGIAVGVAVKIVIEIILYNNPLIGIKGGGVGLIACYFSAILVNLMILIVVKDRYGNKVATAWRIQNAE